MRTNQQFPVDWITFTEEILNEKLYFLCSVFIKMVNQTKAIFSCLK